MNRNVFDEIEYNLAKAQGLLNGWNSLRKAKPPGPEKGEPLEEHRIKGASRTPPKEYAEEGATSKKDYADSKNYKYPLHTEKNVRAAMSYFAQPDNYKMYKPDERKTVAKRIMKAAKKYDIEVSDEWKKKFGLGTK